MMMPHMLQSSSALAAVWVASVWQGVALAVLGVVLLKATGRASAALRHTLLLALFVVAAILPWIRFRGGEMAGAAAPVRIPLSFAYGIALIWVVAVLYRSAHLVAAWLHMRRIRREASPIAVGSVAGCAMGSRHAELCVSADVDAPAVIGFFHPVVLLPEWLLPQLTQDDLRVIAAHECEHLRRGDDWLNLLLQVVLTLLPLNPALYWLNRRIAVQRELACDAAVVRSSAKPLAYAASLTRLAEQRMGRNRLRLALAAWEHQSELAQRVHALLGGVATGWSHRQSVAAGTALTAVLAGLSAAMVHAPTLVSFGSASTATYEATRNPTVTPAETISFGPARMVNAAYNVPAARVPVSARPKQVQHRSSRMHRRARSPLFVRAAMDTQALPQPASGDDLQNDGAQTVLYQSSRRPVRMQPAVFSTPYLAVPVGNGWIVIEL